MQQQLITILSENHHLSIKLQKYIQDIQAMTESPITPLLETTAKLANILDSSDAQDPIEIMPLGNINYMEESNH